LGSPLNSTDGYPTAWQHAVKENQTNEYQFHQNMFFGMFGESNVETSEFVELFFQPGPAFEKLGYEARIPNEKSH